MTLASLKAGISTDTRTPSPTGSGGGVADLKRLHSVSPHSAARRARPRPMASTNSQCIVACSQLAVMKTYQSTDAARSSGGTGGMTWSNVQPASSEAGTISSPLARRPSMMRGSAATVCERSPPASCSSTTLSARFRIGVGHAVHDPLHDQVGGRLLPVVGVDAQTDGRIAQRLRYFHRRDLFRRRRFGVAEEWAA